MNPNKRPVIERLEPRTHAMNYPVASKPWRTVLIILAGFALSIAVFNLAGN